MFPIYFERWPNFFTSPTFCPLSDMLTCSALAGFFFLLLFIFIIFTIIIIIISRLEGGAWWPELISQPWS